MLGLKLNHVSKRGHWSVPLLNVVLFCGIELYVIEIANVLQWICLGENVVRLQKTQDETNGEISPWAVSRVPGNYEFTA